MCGIDAYFGQNASTYVHRMNCIQESRGHDGACIVSCHDGYFHSKRVLGSAKDAFRHYDMQGQFPGVLAIGHTRYATQGKASDIRNTQPFFALIEIDLMEGDEKIGIRRERVAVVHNGQITNYKKLRRDLENKGAKFQSQSDTEVIAMLMSMSSERRSVHDMILDTCSYLDDAYALIFLAESGMFVVTDRNRTRPLAMCKVGSNAYAFASETAAFGALDNVSSVRHLFGAEMVSIFLDGEPRIEAGVPYKQNICLFEFIYLSDRKSEPFGLSVTVVRKNLGIALAERMIAQHPDVEADLIIGVPNSGLEVARHFATAFRELFELKYGHTPQNFAYAPEAIKKNPEVSRTFIEADMKTRKIMLDKKFIIDEQAVKGMSLILVDDSIVRGPTMSVLVRKLKKAGAKAVFILSGAPQIVHTCTRGINIATRKELLAVRYPTHEGKCKRLDAKRVIYTTVQDLQIACQDPKGTDSCVTCFTGRQPETKGRYTIVNLFPFIRK